MNRRGFLRSLSVSATAGVALGAQAAAYPEGAVDRPVPRFPGAQPRGTFALEGQNARFYSPLISRPLRVLMLADTHLFLDDVRGIPFRSFSGRMAGAYNRPLHFLTGQATHPQECFEASLRQAQQIKADLVAIVGDLFSFPSEAAIEWVLDRLRLAGLPYVYVAGNHDWHYEGMEGSIESLRATWIQKRLLPLYQGRDPMASSVEVQGVRFVSIDNSDYQITPAQLRFWRAEVRRGQPMVLFVHIPLYAPGRSVGFGCGHPDWGASSDKGYELERRPRWPEGGHSRATLAFHREVFSAKTLLGVCAGHVHKPALDVIQGVPQLVTHANAFGAHLDLQFQPLNSAGKDSGPRT
jgi:predicted phosphodiesterase